MLSIALIITGSALGWNSFRLYETTIVEEQDDQLYELANSTDRSIKNALTILESEVNSSILKSDITKQRQDAAVETNNYDALNRRITLTALNRNDLVMKIIARKGKKTVFVTDGSKGYKFPEDKGKDKYRICEDKDGKVFLAYECRRDAFTYDILIDATQLYEQIASEKDESDVRMILIDVDSDVAIYRGIEGVTVDVTENIHGGRKDATEFIKECYKEGKKNADSFERTTGNSEVTETVRVAVLPSVKTRNAVFSIGIMTNADTAMAPLRKSIRRMTLYMILAMLGITTMLACILLIRRQSRVQDAELKELQEKNKAMLELNQQMQALTHHQRLETIGTMTSGIAHEFNNLLTPIMGYSMMALEELPEDSEVYDNLIEIYDSSRKAKEVIEGLAEISRKGSSLSYKDVDINTVVVKAIAATSPVHREDIRIVFDKGDSNIKVKGDATQLQQLVMNLILNAHHATEGKGTITLSTRRDEDKAIIIVADTGMGISQSALAHIFDPFYTTKESGKGTGLGLAIAARIVENHGGKIYVESKEGAGTTFTISLPIINEI